MFWSFELFERLLKIDTLILLEISVLPVNLLLFSSSEKFNVKAKFRVYLVLQDCVKFIKLHKHYE